MTTDKLRLALVQDNPVVGDLSANTQSAIQHIKNNIDADLVVFSECFVTGYPLADLVLRPGFQRDVAKHIEMIRDAVTQMQGPAVLIGAPLPANGLPYNAGFLIDPSGTMRSVRKCELPNADVFDEIRTFQRANPEDSAPLTFRGFKLGVQICEDMWHGRVSRELADELADILIVINGSPYHRGKDAERKRHARARVQATGLPLVYVNQFGGQDELVFDGGSFAMNTNGGVISARTFQADTMHILLRRDDDGKVHIEADEDQAFCAYPTDMMETDYRACVLGLRDYIAKTGSTSVYVGVSGGLDSALVLTMAVDAIGADRVTGIMMPSRYTGDESLGLADDLMARLQVKRLILPIEDVVNNAYGTLQGALGDVDDPNLGLMAENLQARTRGMLLMGLTNAHGGIVLSTGNKSEMAVGYATLYGDMCGGFNPMKSVYKSHAFEMARWRNAADAMAISKFAKADPIPDGIITRPPSAELAEGQVDANSLGDYDALDTVLKALIEDRLDAKQAARALEDKFDAKQIPNLIVGDSPLEYATRIARLVRIAQYKRVQSPPGVKLHPTDFGLGWRYPIAGNYTL